MCKFLQESRFCGGRRKASVSILLVIVVPTLLLMGMFLYDLLLLRHREAKALKVVYAVSEAKLAQYNEFLSSECGIQANLDIGTTGEYFSTYLQNNDIVNTVVRVTLKSLDDPKNFEQAVIRSMMMNVGSAALQKILEKIEIVEVVQNLAEKIETLDKKLEELYQVFEFPKRIADLLDSPSIEKVKEGVELIQTLMQQKEDVFKERKASIEGDLPQITLEDVKNEKEQVLDQLTHTWQKYWEDVRDSLSEINRFEAPQNPGFPQPSPGGNSSNVYHTIAHQKVKTRKKTEQEVIESIRGRFRNWSFYKENSSAPGLLTQIKKGLAALKKSLGAFETEAGVLEIKGADYTKISHRSDINLLEKMALVEWVVRNLSSYAEGSEKKHTIRGEVEYIVTGKVKETESVFRIRLEIAGIRMVPNMLTFANSNVRKQITELLGALPPPANYIALGVAYTALVLGESYIDSGRLLQGEEFKFIKDEEDWRLSLEGLTGGVFEELLSSTQKKEKKDQTTLGYLDYLRVLLLFESPKNITLRSMNVVQASVDTASKGEYSLEDYSIGHRVYVSFINQSIVSKREAEIEFENGYD